MLTYTPIQSIVQDRTMRLYGACLALLPALTVYNIFDRDKWKWLIEVNDSICWPMVPDCRMWHTLSAAQVKFGLLALAAASVLTALGFLRPRTVRTAWWSLLVLTVVKTLILLVDYRLRLNQHIMATWVTLAFLLAPEKKTSLKVLIALFYFWSGIIKLTPEWLSGAALYTHPWPIDGPLLPWATGYVVVLEIVLVWGLMWDRTAVAWATLVQLLLFHTMSYQVVGLFYPALMVAILAIYPLSWRLDPDHPSTAVQLRKRSGTWPALALAALFSTTQLWSYSYPGDTALTGEGRLFSLHMFDAYTSCEAEAHIRHRGAPVQIYNLYQPLPVRIHCDPVVYINRARNLCLRNASNPRFENLDLVLRSRRSTAPDYTPVLDMRNFCSQNLDYSLLRTNDWILKD